MDLLENLVINFFWIWSIKKVHIICCILAPIPYLGKIWFLRYWLKCFWSIRLQDFVIDYISKTKWWKSLMFCMLIQINRNLKLIKNIGVGVVKNGCGHSSLRTLKLPVSQKWSNGINWFLVCLQKFRKAKNYFNNFWMLVIKNGHGLVDLEFLKYAVSQEWIYELGWFFARWYKFKKAKSYFNNYWVGILKNGRYLKDQGTLVPGVSHKWLDELSRLIEWFLHADSDGIIFFSTLYL